MLDYPLTDVLDLMRQHLDRARRTQQQAQRAGANSPPRKESGEVIYRKARDDWF